MALTLDTTGTRYSMVSRRYNNESSNILSQGQGGGYITRGGGGEEFRGIGIDPLINKLDPLPW